MRTERPENGLRCSRARRYLAEFVVAASAARAPAFLLIAVTAIALLTASIPAHAEPQSGSQYQLRLANPEAYRLKSGGDYKLTTGATPSVPAHAAVPAPPAAARPYSKTVTKVAAEVGVDPALIYAVMGVESAYDPKAVSPKGAIGLMQLMPDTARRYGMRNPETDSKRPAKNIRAGATYLRDLLEMFDNDVKLALAAYNAGENAVIRHGNKVPPYAETKQYLPKVLDLYDRIKPPVPPKPVRVHKVYSPPLPRSDVDASADASADAL